MVGIGSWKPALPLLCEMVGVQSEPTIRYSTRISACEKR